MRPARFPASIAYIPMPVKRNITEVVEFGDFQTPESLAAQVTLLLRNMGLKPTAILEPTCGKGSFVSAASANFPEAEFICGVEVNSDYIEIAKGLTTDSRVRFFEGDFFKLDWSVIFAQSKGPWLILGNPPWVTNSKLGAISSSNLPTKQNDRKLKGIEAITGKSNFDISEWMILRYLEWLKNGYVIAILCKVTVARKILSHAWENSVPIDLAAIFRIDAMRNFNVAVDACLFVVRAGACESKSCEIYDNLDSATPSSTLSYIDGQIVKGASDYRRGRHLLGVDPNYRWRSGVKHDCSKVMELTHTNSGYVNGLEEHVDIEDTFLYPMYKSSGLSAKPRTARKMLVPQRYPGEDVSEIKAVAPKTWAYLTRHRDLLRKRGSSIYKNKGDFAIFGVGPYSFTPWKVAISGFYKRLLFTVVGPIENRPVVFDDTVYYISCYSEAEATFMADLLNSEITRSLLESLIHWESKRPITVELLKQVSLAEVAREVGRLTEYRRLVDSADPVEHSLGTYGLFQTC